MPESISSGIQENVACPHHIKEILPWLQYIAFHSLQVKLNTSPRIPWFSIALCQGDFSMTTTPTKKMSLLIQPKF